MFTPWPYQIELVNSALKRNTIACLNSPSVKSFVWMTYLKEIGGHNFPVISDNENAVAFALFGSDHVVEVNGVGLQIHLDTRVTAISTVSGLSLTEPQWSELLEQNQVIVTTPSVFAKALTDCLIDTSLIGVLVLDDCHKVIAEDSEYRKIVEAETATDLIALDGCSPSKPDEKIVLCGGKKVAGHDQGDVFCPGLLTEKIREILLPAIEWLKVCQITASTPLSSAGKSSEETNSSSTAESGDADVKPTKATSPNKIDVEGLVNMSFTVLSQVVLVLDVLGLWCAHRLVIMLLKQLQKNLRFQGSLAACDDAPHKWKYFLLRYTDSHLRTVYKMCQTQIGNKKKVDLQLVTPKVDRLLQVLKEYKPPPEVDRKTEQNKSSKYNDRSESGYVSWWQDSEAEEDEEEQMLNRGREKKSEEEKAVSGRARALQYHHPNSLCGIVFVRDK